MLNTLKQVLVLAEGLCSDAHASQKALRWGTSLSLEAFVASSRPGSLQHRGTQDLKGVKEEISGVGRPKTSC